MSAFPLPVQAQSFSLNGAGAVAGATSLVLKTFLQIDGVTPLVMADFGSIGYGTIEPGNGTLEEQISFTGVIPNANGTSTLTGIKSVLFVTPYTETSGLAKTHAGATTFVISNDAGFYNAIKGYIDTAVSAGAVPATTTVNGIGHVSVTPSDPANPIFVGDNDTRVPSTNTAAALAGLSGTAPSATNLFIDSRAMTGMISPYAGRTAPTGFLMCDGTAVSRSTYASLFAVISPSQTATMTIASPAVVTAVAHGLVAGDKIHFSTTGAFATGVASNTDYYVLSTSLATDTFKFALSPEGTAVITSGSQSGTITLYKSAFGKGDGSTTFNVPDLRNKSPFGIGSGGTETLAFESAAVNTGADTVTIPNYVFPSQGQAITLTTTGALPTGLSTSTTYYIIRLSSTTIQFATTQANANAGTQIDLTGAGSGVSTITYSNTTSTILGVAGGEETHGESITEMAAHTHTFTTAANGTSNATSGISQSNTTNQTTSSAGGNTPHNNMMPFLRMNFVIKT